jgi:acetylornithine/succinyldiaminopimelate/putrescine aminotransferase
MSSAGLFLKSFPEPVQTRASRVSDVSSTAEESSQRVLETCRDLIRLRVPNLLRLYLNPCVAQTCVVLSECVRDLFPAASAQPRYPSFLANSGGEALSGAIKLLRYTLNRRAAAANITEELTEAPLTYLCGDGWPPGFVGEEVRDSQTLEAGRIVFLPGIVELSVSELLPILQDQTAAPGVVAIPAEELAAGGIPLAALLKRFQQRSGLVIVGLTAESAQLELSRTAGDFVPDVVVFDQSFTGHEVPFGAFSARVDLYAMWMQRKMSQFHSTTFQPNTISTQHFLRWFPRLLPSLSERLRPELQGLLVDPQLLLGVFRGLFSPSLAKLIVAAGFHREDVTAQGHYIHVGGRRLFDGVGGVACSLRGHNPETWCSEVEQLAGRDCRRESATLLGELTGLPNLVPGVSGASAVEIALRLALTAAWPAKQVVVLRGGYGGKTLLALTGTEKPWYRQHLQPLYPHVTWIDPFAADAAEQLEKTVAEHPTAVVQLELIQGVGGVREVPLSLLEKMETLRRKAGFLVFVDEIQTGVFRTGPFVRSSHTPLRPDLMTLGKGVSDMMFPFALTLYSDEVADLLRSRGSSLPEQLREDFRHETAFRCLLNVLQRSASENISARVSEAGKQLQTALERELEGLQLVRQTRVFGLLAGIELATDERWLQRAGLKLPQLYLLRMLQHRRFPLLMGFCQYQPGVLKFTPPLTVTAEEIRAAAGTIGEALRTSTGRLLAAGLRAVLQSR